MTEIQAIFSKIIEHESLDDILGLVDEAKTDYISDWEDEFDDINDAYEEQGRGEAEAQVINDTISNHISKGLEDNDYCTLYDMLAEHWNLVA